MAQNRYDIRNVRRYKAWSFSTFTALFMVVTILVFVTYLSPGEGLLGTLAEHHIALMAVLIIVSVGFGAAFSLMLLREIEDRNETVDEQHERIEQLETLLRSSLGPDERAIIDHLNRTGESTQQSIGRLDGMYRVKAHRLVKSLETKGIVTVRAEGKQRYVTLTEPFTSDR